MADGEGVKGQGPGEEGVAVMGQRSGNGKQRRRRRPRSPTELETQIEQIEVLDLTQDCIIVE